MKMSISHETVFTVIVTVVYSIPVVQSGSTPFWSHRATPKRDGQTIRDSRTSVVSRVNTEC